MELNDKALRPTLATRLGDTVHLSGLLRNAERLSGLQGAELSTWLLKCAVERGARHYRREFSSQLPPDTAALSDEELGVALCLGHHSYEPHLIRAAAQLLSSSKIDPQKLLHLTVMERCEAVMAHIADACARVDPEREPWAYLRQHLRLRRLKIDAAKLPHWSRFVSLTGFTPAGRGTHCQWLERHEQSAKDPAHAGSASD